MKKRILALALVAGAFLPVGPVLAAEAPAAAKTLAPAVVPGLRFGRKLSDEDKARVMAAVRANGDLNVSLTQALLYRGLDLFNEKEYDLCIPYLEEAVSQDPATLTGWEALGWAYWRLGDHQAAKDLWLNLEQLQPNDAISYNLLAQAAILESDWKAADTFFRKALTIKPDQYEIRFWFAQNLLRIGKPREAEVIVRALIREDPGRLDVQILLARMLMYQQEFDEAAEIWRKVIDEIPDNPDLLLEVAYVELQVGELKRADQLCIQVLGIEPHNERALLMRADLADISDMADLTINRLQELIGIVEDPKVRAQLRVRLAVRCRTINSRKKDPPYSNSYIVGLYKDAIKEDPDNVTYRLALAEVCLVIHKFDAARDQAIEVLEKYNRNNMTAKNILFEVELALANADRADQILDDMYSSSGSKNPIRFYKRAQVMVARREYEQALRLLDQMDKEMESGCVLTLLYDELTESDWTPVTSSRRLYEHIMALKKEGFQLVAAADMPKIFEHRKEEFSNAYDVVETRLPWPARMVRGIRYSFTGDNTYGQQGTAAERQARAKLREHLRTPPKYVCVTFDGANRSSFKYGTSIAEEFGVPFTMFAQTETSSNYVPSRATWSEMRQYAESGAWVLGGYTHDADRKAAIDPKGENKRPVLDNRLWIKSKNRLESMNEWDKRMRYSFRECRRRLKENLGTTDSPVPMIAYPFGDIGQAGACNITTVRNPVFSIASEAGRCFQLGFLDNDGINGGYTCAGNDPLMCPRYRPQWFDEGDDVVRFAYLHHPSFMARKLRVQIAYAQNKPYLAKEMVAQLKKDGYPSDWCRAMDVETVAQFTHKPLTVEPPLLRENAETVGKVADNEADKTGQQNKAAVNPPGGNTTTYSASDRSMGSGNEVPDRPTSVELGDDRPWVSLKHPWLGAELQDSRANGEYAVTMYGVRGGLQMNRRAALAAEYFQGRVRQDAKFSVDNPDYDTTQAVSANNKLYDTRSETYYADREDWRLRYSYLFDEGTTFYASIGQSHLDIDEEKSSKEYIKDGEWTEFEDGVDRGADPAWVGDFGFLLYPTESISIRAFYAHDIAMAAFDKYEYDSVGFSSRWMISDDWHVSLNGQYWVYDDHNAVLYAQLDSFWRVVEDMGLWMGLEGVAADAAQKNYYYWTPYWDLRGNFIFRYRKEYPGFFFNFDAIAGLQQEDARAYDEFSGGQDWEPGFGFAASYQRHLWRSWDFYVELRTMFLHTYGEHTLRTGGIYTF